MDLEEHTDIGGDMREYRNHIANEPLQEIHRDIAPALGIGIGIVVIVTFAFLFAMTIDGWIS